MGTLKLSIRPGVGASIFAFIFLASALFLAYNNFHFPKTFVFKETNKVKGIVTETSWTPSYRGYFQTVRYTFHVDTLPYTGQFSAGKSSGKQKIGDKLLIEYVISDPTQNKVVVFFRN